METAPSSRRIAHIGMATAVVLMALVLTGWLTGNGWLTRFGSDLIPMQPLNAIACLSVAAGMWSAMRGRTLAAGFLLAPAFLIAGASLFQWTTGTNLGVDAILFKTGVTQLPMSFPGRPRVAPAIAVLLIGLAVLLAPSRESRRGRLVVLLASVTLATGLFSLLLPILDLLDADAAASSGPSRPGALAAVSLSIALLAWRSESGWPAVLGASGPEGKVVRLAFPLILLMPVLTSILELWARRLDWVYAASSEALATGANVLFVASLLFWAAGRLIHEREQRLELLRALDPAPIALARLDGTILHWSEGCAQLYGWSAGEALGRVKSELLQSCTRGGSAIPAERLKDREQSEIELVETAKDGTALHIIEQARLVSAEAGRDSLVVLSMTDISARTRAEEALRESQVRLSLALEAHRIGAFEYDALTQQFHWSPGSEERLGLEPGTVPDLESWRAQVEPDDLKAIGYTMAQAVANRANRFSFHYRYKLQDGELRTVEGSSRCFYDPSGSLVRTVGIIMDVTEREAREVELELSQAQLRSILETVPDAMVVVDESGIIHSFSSAAERLFRYRADEIVGKAIGTIMPGARAGARDFVQRNAKPGKRKESRALLSAVRSDGSEIPVELAAGEAVIGDERLLTIFMRDVSERVASDNRLTEITSELLHASRLSAMGEMAEGLAHELNQPLTATVNFLTAAEMLARRPEPNVEQISSLAQTARDQAMRAGEIIRRLRAFLARGEVEVRAEPIDDLIRDALDLVVASSFQPDVSVELDLNSEGRLMLADRVQIQQVLVNLLRNAVEALRQAETPNGKIVISSHCLSDETIEIKVSDNGPGLPGDMLDAAFKGFSSTKEDGMGVGLSISRRIVEAHGGRLTAENGLGGGATFSFTLRTLQNRDEIEE